MIGCGTNWYFLLAYPAHTLVHLPINCSNDVTVYGPDGKTVMSIVSESKQGSICSGFLRNRFSAKFRPSYDMEDEDGKVLYTVVIPVEKDKFPEAFYDESYLAVIPEAWTDDRKAAVSLRALTTTVPVFPKLQFE